MKPRRTRSKSPRRKTEVQRKNMGDVLEFVGYTIIWGFIIGFVMWNFNLDAILSAFMFFLGVVYTLVYAMRKF